MAAPPVPDPIDRRNLSVAFEDANPALAGQTFAPTPTAPTPTRTGKFRSDAISNDPAAYVGRELRPRNSAYTPIATRTTNGDLMGWKQPEVQPAPEPRKWESTGLKFTQRESTTTNALYPRYEVTPEKPPPRKEWQPNGLKFTDRSQTTSNQLMPGYAPEPPEVNEARKWEPTGINFVQRSSTTNNQMFQKPEMHVEPPPPRKEWRPNGLKFTDRSQTTSNQLMPGYAPEPPEVHEARKWEPTGIKFTQRESTTNSQLFKPPEVKLFKPVGIAVEDDKVQNLLHGDHTPPCSVSRSFTTTRTGQTEVAIRLVRGWSKYASQCEHLCVLDMDNIPPGPPGKQEIVVTVSMDKNGKLFAEVKDVHSGMTDTWSEYDGVEDYPEGGA